MTFSHRLRDEFGHLHDKALERAAVPDTLECGDHGHIWLEDFDSGDTCMCGAWYLIRAIRRNLFPPMLKTTQSSYRLAVA